MDIIFNEKKYKLIENNNNGFDQEATKEKMTDYFIDYDYIVGDWAYGKLRLKGFNNKTNKHFNKFNDYQNVKKYLNDYCAYGCKFFIIEKIND